MGSNSASLRRHVLDARFAWAHDGRGTALARARRWAEALGAHERALAIDPHDVAAHIGRGSALGDFGRVEDALRAFERDIELQSELARAHDAELALFLVPSQQELAAGASPDHEEIARWSTANGIDSLRGLEPMQIAMNEGRRPYFGIDIHWTRAGNEVAAAEIAKYVREKRAIHDGKGAANAAPR